MITIKTVSKQIFFIASQYKQGHTYSYIANAYKTMFGKTISRQYVHQIVANTTEYKERKLKLNEVKPVTCLKKGCGHTWTPKTLKKPKVCPKCMSAYWDTVSKQGNYKRKEL